MGKQHRFVSVNQPTKHGYVLYSGEFWDAAYRGTNCPLGPSFAMYNTYGYSGTQHSGAYTVTEANTTDYLQSLTAYIVGTPHDDTTLNDIASAISYGIYGQGTHTLRFCLETKFKPGKDRYASPALLKVGTSRDLKYDKRYVELTERHDGSVRGAMSLLYGAEENRATKYAMERFMVAGRLRDLKTVIDGEYCGDTPAFVVYGESYDLKAKYERYSDAETELSAAMAALVSALDGIEKRMHAVQYITRLRESIEAKAVAHVAEVTTS